MYPNDPPTTYSPTHHLTSVHLNEYEVYDGCMYDVWWWCVCVRVLVEIKKTISRTQTFVLTLSQHYLQTNLRPLRTHQHRIHPPTTWFLWIWMRVRCMGVCMVMMCVCVRVVIEIKKTVFRTQTFSLTLSQQYLQTNLHHLTTHQHRIHPPTTWFLWIWMRVRCMGVCMMMMCMCVRVVVEIKKTISRTQNFALTLSQHYLQTNLRPLTTHQHRIRPPTTWFLWIWMRVRCCMGVCVMVMCMCLCGNRNQETGIQDPNFCPHPLPTLPSN